MTFNAQNKRKSLNSSLRFEINQQQQALKFFFISLFFSVAKCASFLSHTTSSPSAETLSLYILFYADTNNPHFTRKQLNELNLWLHYHINCILNCNLFMHNYPKATTKNEFSLIIAREKKMKRDLLSRTDSCECIKKIHLHFIWYSLISHTTFVRRRMLVFVFVAAAAVVAIKFKKIK